MKKIISLFICFILSVAVIGVHAITFTDLQETHWAYENIMNLVEAGTVNGFEDGTFRPSDAVTRAQFVKMLGKWDRAYEGEITDISSQHWGYEYIIWSGLEPEHTKIYPDKPMLRSDVINLIWKRNGSPKHDDAPYVISKQGTNMDATSWAYTIGLLKGDDGFNLHLDRVLNRAEAATLIVRSKSIIAANEKYNFKELVRNDLLKELYDNADLFPGKEYERDATFTYGELARAVLLVGTGNGKVSYDGVNIDPDKMFDHEYSKDLYALADKLWGMDYYNKTKIDQKANIQDTLSGLLYGLVIRGGQTVNLGKMDSYYSDCTGANSTSLENLCLSFAADNGIKLTAGKILGAGNEATLADVALFLLQLDKTVGMELSYIGTSKYNTKTNLDLATYPANYADYKAVLEGIPSSVYNYKPETVKPIDYYRVAERLSFVFSSYITEVKSVIQSEQSVLLDCVYYPSLTYSNGGKIVFIAKCVAKETAINIDETFSKFLKKNTGLTAAQHEPFYVVFETYGPLMDVYLPYTEAYIKDIILP